MSLYLATKTAGKYKYLKLVDVYKENVNGKLMNRERIVENFGRIDKLEKENPGIVEKLKAKYSDPNVKYFNFTDQEIKKIAYGEKVDVNQDRTQPFLMSYATVIPRYYWKEKLKITPLIRKLQGSTRKVNDFDNILNYFCATKIVKPMSAIQTYYSLPSEINVYSNYNEQDIYRSLTFFNINKDLIMEHIFERVSILRERKITLVFFDTTNVYFEKMYDDIQEFEHDTIKKLKEDIRKKFENTRANYVDEDAFESEIIKSATLEAYDIIEKEKEKNKTALISEIIEENTCDENEEETFVRFFKMKGPCKSHRYDLPLVSIALAIDEEGIPIDYIVFPGNTHDTRTLMPTINRMKEKYNIGECILVSDKGVNSFANLYMLNHKGYGFIIANSVYKFTKGMEEEILNGKGFDSFEYRNEYATNSDNYESEKILYKVLNIDKNGKIYDKETDKNRNQSINYSVVITFSEKRRQRDLAAIELDVYKAAKAVKNKQDISSKSQNGWRGLVVIEAKKEKNGQANKKASEKAKKTMYQAVEIDEEKIAKRRKLAGYSAIIFKKPLNYEGELTADAVITAYHRHVAIENCFRVMKSDFNLRPIRFSTKEHIEAHIGICVISLIILRLISLELKEKNIDYTDTKIKKTLGSALIIAQSSNGKEGNFVMPHNLFSRTINIKKKNYKEAILDYKQKNTDLNKIMEALGFGKIESVMSSRDFARAIKAKQGYENLVGKIVSDIQNPNFEEEYNEEIENLSINNILNI